MKRVFVYIVGILALLGNTACDTTDPYSDLINLEFEVTGGFAGIHHKTIITENKAVFENYYGNKKYVISTLLTEKQLDSLNKILMENNIFNFDDTYKALHPVMDGINVTIKFNNGKASKNIYIEAGADIPKKLENIIQKLHEITTNVRSNSEYATLTIPWPQPAVIKKWIFPNIKLQLREFHYYELSNSDSIMIYFNEIKTNYGDNVLYWDQDSLYVIYDGRDYGYFNVYTAYPIKYWFEEFNYDISAVQENGIVLSLDEWEERGIYLNKTYVYVLDMLEDNGRAIKVSLIPGKVERIN